MPPAEFTAKSHRDGDVHTVCLCGEFDLAVADGVQLELERVEAGDARSIVIDLAGVTFLDSTGIRLLWSAHARSRADGLRLTLRPGPPAVQRALALCGLADQLPFTDSTPTTQTTRPEAQAPTQPTDPRRHA